MPHGLDPHSRRCLADTLGRALGNEQEPIPSPEALLGCVDSIVQRVRSAWPELLGHVEDEALAPFVLHLAERIAKDQDLVSVVQGLAVADLYLAFACGQRVQAALETFENLYGLEVAHAAAKMRKGPNADDARQLIWQKLFVGSEDDRPRILEYSGRGALRDWYRVVIVRCLLDLIRREGRRGELHEETKLLEMCSPNDDPETEYLKRRYRHEFRRAFERATELLSPEDRNVLRSYYVHELTVDQIASVFGVHRATAARRVQRAREALHAETRRQLEQNLKLPKQELESVIRLIESQMDLTISRLLG